VWNSLVEADRRGFDDYQIDALIDVLNKRVKAQVKQHAAALNDA
jgi:hypothetical protein